MNRRNPLSLTVADHNIFGNNWQRRHDYNRADRTDAAIIHAWHLAILRGASPAEIVRNVMAFPTD